MKRNFTTRLVLPAQAVYLPEEMNFWTIAIIAVGTGFILIVAVSIYLICQTSLERPLPVRHHRTVRHISQGPDILHRNHPYLHHSSARAQLHHHNHHHLHHTSAASTSLHFLDPTSAPLNALTDDE